MIIRAVGNRLLSLLIAQSYACPHLALCIAAESRVRAIHHW
jgi:hypothetical protein